MTRCVLLVEDNWDNRAIYRTMLEVSGYRVLEASNGAEAVELARDEAPDLILMDLSMPVMDGWEAMQRLRADARTAGIPVCAVSAHVVLGGEWTRVQEAGFACYLTKPIEPKDVLREVEERIGPAEAAGGSGLRPVVPEPGER